MTGENENTKRFTSVAKYILGILIGSFSTAVLGFLTLELDKQKAAADFMKIIADKNAEEYSKGLALSSLLRFELVEPDLLFSVGYQHEDKYGPGILKDLMYEYGYKHCPMRTPIGYLDLPGEIANGEFSMKGWAIDDKSSKFMIEIWADNTKLEKPGVVSKPRKDVKTIFKKYDLPQDPGFTLKGEMPKEFFNKKVKLRVRITDEQSLFVDIFNSDVCITETSISRPLSSDCSF